MVDTFLQILGCITFFTLIPKYSSLSEDKGCQYSPPASQCPDKWALTESPPTCVRKGDGQLAWTAAREWCQGQDADLVVLHDGRSEVFFTDYMKPFATVWIALNDRQSKGKYVWISGDPTNHTSWASNEPNPGKGKRCVTMDSTGAWSTKLCGETHSFLCQKTSYDGPSDIQMEIVFHRPPNVFFVGHEATVTCTAMGAEDGNIKWVTLSESLEPVDLHSQITQKEETYLTTDGKCHQRFESTYTFNTHDHFHGIYLACFSYRSENDTLCARRKGRLVFCDIAHQFSLVDGPKQGPVFHYYYKGKPAPIEAGGVVKAVCTLYAGKQGLVQWVLNMQSGRVVVSRNSSLITNYEVRKIGQDDRHISSTLRLRMSRDLSGASISCFAYDADSLQDPRATQCTRPNPFCERSDPLYVADSPDERGQSIYLYIIDFVIFIMVVIVAILLSPFSPLFGFREDAEIQQQGEITAAVTHAFVEDVAKPDDQDNPEIDSLSDKSDSTDPDPAEKNRNLLTAKPDDQDIPEVDRISEMSRSTDSKSKEKNKNLKTVAKI